MVFNKLGAILFALMAVMISRIECDLVRNDQEAILAFYSQLSNTGSLNWNINDMSQLCQNSGVLCSTDGLNILGLDLHDRNIQGTISTELARLSMLQTLSLQNNTLQGTIPTFFDRLQNLKYINLSTNHLNGRFPTGLTTIQTLTYVDVSNNNMLSSKVWSKLRHLSNIQDLYMNNNKFSGTIPSWLAQLTKLQNLDLSFNTLNGIVPTQFGELTQLQTLRLNNNKLTGALPSELGNLNKLTTLNLHNNLIGRSVGKEQGTYFGIPSEISKLSNLQSLYLDHNQLKSTIPSELSLLLKLTVLTLNTNQIVGNIPTTIGQMSALMTLQLNDNILTSSVPTEIANLHNLKTLDFSDNKLSGVLPTQIGSMTGLTTLSLNMNMFTGSVPTAFFSLSTNARVKLATNSFDCPIANYGSHFTSSDYSTSNAACSSKCGASNCNVNEHCYLGYVNGSTHQSGICYTNTLPCSSNPCQNSAACTNYPNGTYTCDCSFADFTGPTCSVAVNNCGVGINNPCQHGGKCVDQVHRFICDCTSTGFFGKRCTVPPMCPSFVDSDNHVSFRKTAIGVIQSGHCQRRSQSAGGISPKRLCQADGTWSNTITNPCIPLRCPQITEPLYHSVFPATIAGDFADGHCQRGYTGFPYRKCHTSGEWHGEFPGCVRRTCLADTFEGKSFGITEAGGLGKTDCMSGQIYNRRCTVDGTWENHIGNKTCSISG